MLPGFSARNSLNDNDGTRHLLKKYEPGLVDLVSPADYIDPDCYEPCVSDCPPSGPQRVRCVNGCKRECTRPGCMSYCGSCVNGYRSCRRSDCSTYSEFCGCEEDCYCRSPLDGWLICIHADCSKTVTYDPVGCGPWTP
jgi:hypothetical protein